MNDLTKLKHYLDKCVGGGNPENSKFRIVKRTYDNERNRYTIDISYSYRDSNALQVSPSKPQLKSRRQKLYDEIIRGSKIKIGKNENS